MYSNYGEYLDKVRPLNGTLHSVSFVQTDNMDDVRTTPLSGVVDMCSVLSIQAGDIPMYLGITADNGDVIDGSIVEANLEYSSGTLIRNSDLPYKFKTHFLPCNGYDNFIISADGNSYSLPSDTVAEIGDYNATIYLPADFAEVYNLLEGSVINTRYTPPTIDPFGRPYDVCEMNMDNLIGKPDISVNEAFTITDNYLYIPVSGGSLSYAEDEYVGYPSVENCIFS